MNEKQEVPVIDGRQAAILPYGDPLRSRFLIADANDRLYKLLKSGQWVRSANPEEEYVLTDFLWVGYEAAEAFLRSLSPTSPLAALDSGCPVVTGGEGKLDQQIDRLRRIANSPERPALVCDGCGAVYVDDDASDNESCDNCGRFKQRMEWANTWDVARESLKIIDSLSAVPAPPAPSSLVEAIRKWIAERRLYSQADTDGMAERALLRDLEQLIAKGTP